MQLSHLHMRDRLIFIADGGGGGWGRGFWLCHNKIYEISPLMLCSILMILPNRK